MLKSNGLEWIDMKTITLDAGTDTVTRSHNDVNQSVLGSVLVFQKLKVTVSSLETNVVGGLLVSGRANKKP